MGNPFNHAPYRRQNPQNHAENIMDFEHPT